MKCCSLQILVPFFDMDLDCKLFLAEKTGEEGLNGKIFRETAGFRGNSLKF
jgi:hypothetical protein